jgi:hypothetical protein
MEVLYRFLRCVNLPFHWIEQCGISQLKHYNHCDVAPFIMCATFFFFFCDSMHQHIL